MTKIEWTDKTWNPTTGCTKVSSGCKNCYAEIMTKRLKAMGQEKYSRGFNTVVEHPGSLDIPRRWKKPRRIFVNSMSDLFHKDVSTEFIQEVFKVMNETPRHQYQILTKRPKRAVLLNYELNWTDNIWLGTSIENQDVMDRAHSLIMTNAKVKFVSAEPLIGELNFYTHNANYSYLEYIDWVIVGGETVKGREMKRLRPIMESWVNDIIVQCRYYNTAFLFKQWGDSFPDRPRTFHGKEWNEYPVELEMVS